MSCPTDFYFKHITYFKVSFVYIASFTIQVILMQLYSDKQENNDSVMQTEFNSAVKQL